MRVRTMATVAVLLAAVDGAGASATDLTVEVGGDLLRHGGVVVVHHIPSSAEAWAEAAGDDTARVVRIDDRYAEIQLRYPEDGTFHYRFRPVEGTPDADRHATQVLTIIGTDMEDRGPRMTTGFEDAHSSGGRVIRVPSMAELAAPAGATRTNARWGVTERYDAPPPADERSARALTGIVRHGRPEEIPLRCEGDGLVQVCGVEEDRWPGIEALWWRAIAEQRLERLRHHALRRCYDGSGSEGGTCDADPDSDEPAYLYRN